MYKILKHSSIKVFSLMFGIIFLLNMNYTVLKSVRKTLAIADLGGSAVSIPLFELFGVLPAAIFMTWFLSKILKKFSMKKVFFIILFIFIFFFIFFAGFAYPNLVLLQTIVKTPFLMQCASMSFYIMGELWKPALIQILFLGLINFNLSVDQAKGIYPSLMLGASLGAIFAGPLTIFCNSKVLWSLFPLAKSHWNHSLILMMSLIFLIGLITAFFYSHLCRHFTATGITYEKEKSFSFKEALQFFLETKSLRLMGWIVFADYIAYSLAEVLFLQVLKEKYPLPTDYCTFMGYLTFWHSLLTIFFALFIAPILLKKIRWVTCAIILPVGLFLSEGIFFFFLCSESLSSSLFALNHDRWLNIVVFLGGMLFCVCRAVKYTIFDPCKELAFVSMPPASKMKGKLIIDGLCSKCGKGMSSASTIGFVSIAQSISGSYYMAAIFALSICLSLILSTTKLGVELEKRALPV